MLSKPKSSPKPSWLKIKPASARQYTAVKKKLNMHGLKTVCEEADCPNRNECWSAGEATVMMLGDTCTRNCRFCAIKTGNPGGRLDSREPERISTLVSSSGLHYIVLTCVDRDDLPDGGAGHMAETIMQIKAKAPLKKVEALIADYSGNISALKKITAAGPEVIGHNVETVARLTPAVRDKRCSYDLSLQILQNIKAINSNVLTKSSLMLGLGENYNDIVKTFADLKTARVDIITLGQYLQPGRRHLPVSRFYTPAEFADLARLAQARGFAAVAAGPLVRSSYKAASLFKQ
ncbi:MAG TPA: lipoyl synthase, partial [Spirochaetota bacterium]|nr:lipoyl synthase [Spirochaetota bacterium]